MKSYEGPQRRHTPKRKETKIERERESAGGRRIDPEKKEGYSRRNLSEVFDEVYGKYTAKEEKRRHKRKPEKREKRKNGVDRGRDAEIKRLELKSAVAHL